MADSSAPTPSTSLTPRSKWGIGIAAVVGVAGISALIVWAVLISSGGAGSGVEPGFERFEPAWSSAMRKVGIEATFPGGPVDLTQVTPVGQQDFEATLTASEVSALLSVYRFQTQVAGQDVAVTEAAVEFPRDGVGALAGVLLTGGSAYNAEVAAPLTYTPTGIESPGVSQLRVEGFSVGGPRRRQAGEGLVAYLNLYLQAAPGLTVRTARIVEGGLAVTGSAPEQLIHPEPVEAP